MTELEKMKRAKMYIDKLAGGVDPITDEELPQDSVLNNVRLSRCFFYVADILRQVIENGAQVGKKTLEPFRISPDEISLIKISEEALPISRFCDIVNEAVNNINMKKLTHKPLTDWLLEKSFLRLEEIGNTKKKRAGEYAPQIGIFEETRAGLHGEYLVVLYSPAAQQFLLDNLAAILESGKSD